MMELLQSVDSARLLDRLNFWAVILLALLVAVEAVVLLRPKKGLAATGPGRLEALSKRQELLLLGLLCLLAGAIRLFRLGASPAGFNVDEASIAYDAWCMAEYGTDRFGITNPAYLISWGSGQDVLYAWLLQPVYKLLGFSVFATRLPQAVVGTAAVPVFYLLLKQLGGKGLGFIGAALLAISPWHIMASRWALIVYPLVPLLCAGLLFFLLAQKHPAAYLAAFACWAFCLYAYLTASLFLLPFLALLFGYHILFKKINWKWFLIGAGLGLVIAFPIAWFVLVNNGLAPEIRSPLFSVVKLFIYRQEEVASDIYQNGRLVADLLVWQRPDWANSFYDHVDIYGIVYLFSAPFAAGGAFALCRRAFRNARARVYSAETVWLFWLAAAVFASLMIHPNTFNRCIPLVFIYIVLTAYGLRAAMARLFTLRFGVVALYAAAFCLFCHSYFFTYAPDIGRPYNTGLMEAYQLADEVAGEREILVPANVGFFGAQSTYPYICLNRQIPPGEFDQRYNRARNPAYAGSVNLDNVHLLADDFEGAVAPYGEDKVYVLDNLTDPVWDYEAAGFTVQLFGNYTVAWQ